MQKKPLDAAAQLDADTRHAQTVAERFAEMAANFREGGADIPQLWADANHVREVILASHANREPLRLDLLAVCRSSDLSHDIAGILRGDEFQSARFALAYHPRDKITPAQLIAAQGGAQ